MINIYFDTEFTGLHQNTTLISIGLISEDNKTFYAEFTDYDTTQCDEWIKENVLSKLYLHETNTLVSPESTTIIGNKEDVRYALGVWLSQFESITMVSDTLAYDWVLFCNIWNHAFNIPKNVYYIPIDIATMFVDKGIDPDINREAFANTNLTNKHNALHDAKVIKECYHHLLNR